MWSNCLLFRVYSQAVNRVRQVREERNLTQSALAEAASIARQSLGAIESGKADPSVSVALRIARALEVPVEELFGQSEGSEHVEAELSTSEPCLTNARASLIFTSERWVAHPLSPNRNEAADGLIIKTRRRTDGIRAKVEPLRPLAALRDNFLMMGCAPALGILVNRLNVSTGPGHFLWIDKPSVEALDALTLRQTHAAGIHLPPGSLTVPKRARARLIQVTLVHWETGLVVAPGNPLGIRGIRDLARRELRICARQPSAGSQRLLESCLEGAGLDPTRTLAHATIADGHFSAAQAVALGATDVAIAMESAALAFGLEFLPLATERFDLIFREEGMSDPRVVRVFDLMNTTTFRQELGALGGYDTRACGSIVSSS